MTKSLSEISGEIEDFERDKGWLDQEFSFGERMALLHSEVSEALEAYRVHGLDDYTGWYTAASDNPKPEGVGSEFADIFIRLVGDCRRDGVDLAKHVELAQHGKFGIREKFGEQITTLHQLIALVYMHWENEINFGYVYAKVYVYLTQLCELHGIDLMAEYERKMAYNRTRPYRHGGKAI